MWGHWHCPMSVTWATNFHSFLVSVEVSGIDPWAYLARQFCAQGFRQVNSPVAVAFMFLSSYLALFNFEFCFLSLVLLRLFEFSNFIEDLFRLCQCICSASRSPASSWSGQLCLLLHHSCRALHTDAVSAQIPSILRTKRWAYVLLLSSGDNVLNPRVCLPRPKFAKLLLVGTSFLPTTICPYQNSAMLGSTDHPWSVQDAC